MKYILSLVMLFSLSAFAKTTDKMEITISGMACAVCEGKVKKAIKAYDGVDLVSVSAKEGKAVVMVKKGLDINTTTFKNYLKEKSGFSATTITKTN